MKNNLIGERFKYFRRDLFEESQQQFCENINNYILSTYGKKESEKHEFTQPTISSFEKTSNIIFPKFIILIHYLYAKKNINPAWLIFNNNNNQPKFLKKFEIDKGIDNLVLDIDEKQNEISANLNSIRLILHNSPFKE